MKTHARIAGYQRLRGEVQWRLLAADLGPVVLGLLRTLLLEGERTLPASVLLERLARELDDLRARGQDLPRQAPAYVADWLAAGYLERRFPEGGTEEIYELTTAAIAAIRVVDGMDSGRSAATESRLSLVMQQLVQLAAQTDPDPRSRLEGLLAERERIDAAIAAVQGGQIDVLAPERAVERLREAIALADELTEDFRRVRDEFQSLNRSFREQVIEDEGQRGRVLEALFDGVDVIADSEAGRSFDAFWRLLLDAERSGELEAAIEALVQRDFFQVLGRPERMFLLQFTRVLLDRGGQVHEVLQRFARSLKGFVESREYLEQRRLSRLLHRARTEALAIREQVPPERSMDLDLRLSSARLRSLSQWKLHDPRAQQVDGHVVSAEGASVTLDVVGGLVAESEIDFGTLRGHVRAALQTRGQCSIGQLLEHFPAEQGLGSVVGYLTLASRHGVPEQGRWEWVAWCGRDGRERSARVPLLHFIRERVHELD